jgi:predicted nucleic acid-binding protein
MTARKVMPRRILVDINVLFNDFLSRNSIYGIPNPPSHELRNRMFASDAITYLRQRRLFVTYVADFSVAKFISLMHQVKAPKSLQIEEIENLLAKNRVVSLGSRIIQDIMEETKNAPAVKDLEDALQYVVARKQKCTHILTFNKADFNPFDIDIILPGKIRNLF